MTIYKEFNIGGKGNPLGFLGPLIGFAIFLALMYFLVQGVFQILLILSPFLLLGAALLDYKVILDFGKFIIRLLKENPVMGLVAIILSILAYPALFGFLFLKAYARNRMGKVVQKQEAERNRYDKYEEVKEEKEEDFMILPNVEKQEPVKKSNKSEYDDLFN